MLLPTSHFLFSLVCFVIGSPQAFLSVTVSDFKSFRYYRDTQRRGDPHGISNIHSVERPPRVQVEQHPAVRTSRRKARRLSVSVPCLQHLAASTRVVSTKCCRERPHEDSHSCHLQILLRETCSLLISGLGLRTEAGREDQRCQPPQEKRRRGGCRHSPTDCRRFLSEHLHPQRQRSCG